MKKTIILSIVVLFVLSMIPVSAQFDKTIKCDKDCSGGRIINPEPIVEEENPIIRSSGSKRLCEVSNYCRRTLVNSYQEFYINGEKHYLKKHWILPYVTIYDETKFPLWVGKLDSIGDITKLGLHYEVEDRRWRADRVRLSLIKDAK